MATHDYVIDNSTGANVRADINNVLAAIVSNNSGSSEPATTYAYQWWADTSAGVLKIRNSSNNAWIELLQLDGTLTLEDGSASTPALAFRDDLNTGIFSSAADTFDIATAGVQRLTIDSSGNVGIGTTSMGGKLSVQGSGGGVALQTTDAVNSTFRISHPSSAVALLSSGSGHALALGTGFAETMRIDSSGRLLLGATANNASGTSAKFQVSYAKTSEFGIHIRPSDNNTGGGNPMLFQNQAGTSIGSVSADASAVSFNETSDYRLKENDVIISDGITRLKKLRPIRFNWKITPEKTRDGFFAHEVSEAVPEAVTGEKDGTEIQQLDNSKLVPLLVAAVKELIGKVEALEAA